MPDLPKTLIVVGGGVIGVEYTCMFAALGVRVILVEKRPRLLEFADQEIVEALCYHLRDSRVTMRLNEEVESVEDLADGTVVANSGEQEEAHGDALLYAVGRQGNVDELNLAAAGVGADARGRIRWTKISAPSCRIFSRPAMSSDSQPGVGFHGAGAHRRGAGLRRRDVSCRTRAIIPTGFIRFRRSPSSAKPKSS